MTQTMLVVLIVLAGVALLIWWMMSRGQAEGKQPPLDKVSPKRDTAQLPPKTVHLRDIPEKVATPKPAPAVKKKATPKAKAAVTKAPVAKAATTPKADAPKKAANAKVVSAKPAASKVTSKTKIASAPAKPAKLPATKPKAATKAKPALKPVIPDNLEYLKGVGPKLNTLLKTIGITSFQQVASWTADDIAEIDAKLGTFAGRIKRDNWVDQAKLLVVGDVAGFEKKYGALGREIRAG